MEYARALEEERKKILVFERELPLSLQLVTQAIETCKRQQREEVAAGSEEMMSSEGPVLEEFIPLRPSCSSEEEDGGRRNGGGGEISEDGADAKPDWLRSVQLWNQQPEPKGDVVRRPIAVNAKRVGGAFHPFEREKSAKALAAAAPASSTAENTTNGGGGSAGSGEEKEREKEKDKEGQPQQRKARRCWSPELHRRFLNALQQLGGSHVATPKQIRELMKVDGLTNDEVKSHLQKYRLHNRRPSAPAVQSNGNNSPQQPQIVLLGGIWMPPPEYTAAAAAAAAAQSSMDTAGAAPSEVYAPIASLPSELASRQVQQKPQQSKKKATSRSPTSPLDSTRRSAEGDDSEDCERTNSGSSATSSSQTTTVAPQS